MEGKEDITGQRSGTSWEIDAQGVRTTDGGCFIVECRRYTPSKQSQEKIAALAYRIIDTGASGGIIVSPLGLQEGAEKVAAAEDIFNVRLDQNRTRHQFAMQFVNRTMTRLHEKFCIFDHAEVTVIDSQGNDLTSRSSQVL